jgi:hypothetical protein
VWKVVEKFAQKEFTVLVTAGVAAGLASDIYLYGTTNQKDR